MQRKKLFFRVYKHLVLRRMCSHIYRCFEYGLERRARAARASFFALQIKMYLKKLLAKRIGSGDVDTNNQKRIQFCLAVGTTKIRDTFIERAKSELLLFLTAT